ncbi:MAG TPA: NADH-quinone oxidoreductase subunit N, partial [Anaerolineae bacterium]|nr:NADH-quinone oxidoreductase subunit N [Anaerolineae bacterium]
MDFIAPALDMRLIMPVFIVAGWGVVLLVLDLFLEEGQKKFWPWVAAIGLVPAFFQTVGLWGQSAGTFTPVGRDSMILVDNYSTFLNITLLLTGFFAILISSEHMQRMKLDKPEYYMLILISLSGMMLMGMANDLILVFLALELFSIPLYILSAFALPDMRSEEAGLKYFLLGAFSSGFLVFGIALIYGATGSTALPVIAENLAGSEMFTIGLMGVALLLVGLAFKVSAAPFHMWTPDVYDGAPTTVTAFMSVGAKVGGFAAMMRIFFTALMDIADVWMGPVAVLAALTMILGNVIALAQPNIKRMLAYSSISHAGYIMMAVAAGALSDKSQGAALFYLFAYLFTNMGAFAVVSALETADGKGLMLDDYKGLANKNYWMALAMAYLMLSFTGVPPSGGFMGKFFVFQAALEADLLWLTLIGVVTSVISGYYYLRVVYYMFMFEGNKVELKLAPAVAWTVIVTTLVTLLLGVSPNMWFELVRDVAVQVAPVLFAG